MLPFKWENPDITFLTSIREKLETVPPLSSTCSIHKVPKMLRSVNDKAYNPKVISIGPFHRGEESLQVMEEHKWRYLRIFLDWYPQIKLEHYVEVLRGLEESARQCYVEPIKLGSYEFVEMMLLDGFFILVLFLKMWTHEWDSRDPIFRTRWMLGPIMLDMLLLENQIPFFVLKRLFQLSEVPNQDDERRPSLLELTYVFFRKFLKRDEILDQTISRSEVKHLLDFVQSFLLPSSIMVLPHGDTRYDFTPTATELHEAGVEFKVVKSNCLLDISFRNRVLEIPFLKIEDGTELLFRNLIAWEQCQTLLNCEITSYAYLMDGLIKTPKDVD
ncbi:hypothetical protein HHK36_025746 [Tetracentron sinense]|uniref:Uncharacterized protein n=1 Tax=Tetracentron sinense TaxID=13715 RepID=A0A834YNS6_TETSI|nr:hypothetical protein HHK36_025746 [Tetracentron sinense]